MGEIIGGILLVVRSEFAIIQFHRLGYSAWTTLFIVSVWTTFRLITDFYFAAAIDRFIIIPHHWDEKFNRFIWMQKIRQSMANGRKKILFWLLSHRKIVILLILFLPFTPLLEDIAIVAARLSRIKKFLPLMILANGGRMILVTFCVYALF